MRLRLAILMIVAGGYALSAQSFMRVMAYNVENLFDTKPDRGKEDAEFLPDSKRCWTVERYWQKLNQLAKVIAAVGETAPPGLVALCEVENDSVMFELTRRSVLRLSEYQYVMTDSPDRRGVDVALLWQPRQFRMLASHAIRIPSAEYGFKPTRDILYAKGEVFSGDTLHVLVCHLPSRAGGAPSSAAHRRLAFSVLREAVDSLLSIDTCSRILVAGDMNSMPGEDMLRNTLGVSYRADKKSCGPRCVLHALTTRKTRGRNGAAGTYRYQGEWNCLDHLLVSHALWEGNGRVGLDSAQAVIADFHFLLEPDVTHGGVKPFRTYRGILYHGGYSDHLPVYADIWMKRE